MALINYSSREINCKIIYYGCGLGGKTTNLLYIHEKIPDNIKGKMVSLATETDRTLFFDFLPLELGSVHGFRTRFHLYTVPGQVHYDASRKLILKGVDGIVFVVDSQRERFDDNIESFENMKINLKKNGYDLKDIPYVIQYNKRDLSNIMLFEDLDKIINTDNVPAFEAIAVKGVGVFETLKAISKLVIAKLSRK
jgi:hypothetical protein